MDAWRFYDPATGIMLGTRLFCERSQVAANTPAGHLPIRGELDPLSQRIDVSVPRPPDADDDWHPPVVDWQPPAPPGDAMQTWQWDAAARRWVSAPTLAALKRDARQRMASAWDQARSAGVTVGGKTAPTDAAAWTRYLVIRQMAGEAVGWVDVPIPLVDGTFELLTLTKANALWAALKTMERTLLAQLRDRVEAINAAQTAAEVAAVMW